MTNIIPKLKPITVDPKKLLLDANNPRLGSEENKFSDSDVIAKNIDTYNDMKNKDNYYVQG